MSFGNTPGHLNHWSKRSFSEAGRPPRRDRRAALAASVDDGARPRRRVTPEDRGSYGRGAALLSALIGVTGPAHVRVPLARRPRAGAGRLRHRRRALGGRVPDRVGDLPARGAAALAHPRGAAGAGAPGRGVAAGGRDDPGRARDPVRRRRAARARSDPGRALQRQCDVLLVPGRGGVVLCRELLRPRLPRRRAAVRPLRRAGADGVRVASGLRGAADRGSDQRTRRGRDRDRRRAAAEPLRRAVGAGAPRRARSGAGSRRPTPRSPR